MTYAIIETSGKQLWIEPGKFYDLNYLSANPGDKIILNKVLLIKQENSLKIGAPWLKDACVEATILQHLKSKKVTVYKMQPKKKTRKKQGHRQSLTRLFINSIYVSN
uniref:Large ribosomal subunit protein bL21m n=1 Tax=Sciadococcus taiwanensis TaxID=3028030 RepID=A0A9Y1MWX8_9RHOD|nr:ribosomal protein L21 [Sciadococcus taiwanensis]